NRVKPMTIIQKHRNNRKIQINRKGYKPSIRKRRYEIQPKDIVWIDKKMYEAVGIQNLGKYICLKDNQHKLSVSTKKITNYFNFGSLSIIL
ncbi:unnamed protein product, partial [marine sediment metagenome]